MALHAINPTHTEAWKKLEHHFNAIKDAKMINWFDQDSNRAKDLSVAWEDFYVDFSKNRITLETLELFCELADEVNLKDAISKYFSGDIINKTENRAVLHTALRASEDDVIHVNDQNIVPEIQSIKRKIERFTNNIVDKKELGYTGKPFTDIVNIGIGGSDLGPAMVVDALQYYKNHLSMHFVSNVDGDHVHEVLKKLNPETTLFIIVSKTFTTQETLSNANTIRKWFIEHTSEKAIAKHFVAVSTNRDKVTDFGIDQENIFPMWNWVGGRFSLWSAVGLSISLSIGYTNFEDLLKGANKMDRHFKDTPFQKNIPVLSAFLSIWYANFFKAETEAVIPYSQYLNQFTTYLQQAIMESNGKEVDRDGKDVLYQTGSIIWGEPGTNSQHAFFQLIHQGTKLIPCEFIGFAQALHKNRDHQDKLMSNFFAQTEALLKGKDKNEVIIELKKTDLSESQIEELWPYKIFPGNKPTTSILIKKLTPESLGKLIALYEHKIFVQGVIWNILSYDQYGVELGKALASKILKEIEETSTVNHDTSTLNLIEFYKNLR